MAVKVFGSITCGTILRHKCTNKHPKGGCVEKFLMSLYLQSELLCSTAVIAFTVMSKPVREAPTRLQKMKVLLPQALASPLAENSLPEN